MTWELVGIGFGCAIIGFVVGVGALAIYLISSFWDVM